MITACDIRLCSHDAWFQVKVSSLRMCCVCMRERVHCLSVCVEKFVCVGQEIHVCL